MLATRSAPLRGRDHAFDEAGVIVLVVAGQAVVDFVERKFRQERDAVERLLPVHREIVAERLERLARERIVDGFGLLQADDVGLALGKPGARGIDALLDRIDVPGGDAHGARCWVAI